MTHTHCDRCGEHLPEGDGHFTVRMESRRVEPTAGLTDDDFDPPAEADSVHEMTLLLGSDLESDDTAPADPMLRRTFDFCDGCYRRFAADPLSMNVAARGRFSPN